MILDNYLEYLEEKGSAWKKRVRSDSLSDKSIKKLRSIAKPEEEWKAGVDRGSDEMLRKIGNDVGIARHKTANLKGPWTLSAKENPFGQHTVLLPEKDPKLWRWLVTVTRGVHFTPEEYKKLEYLLKRHEVDEVKALIAQKKRLKDNDTEWVRFEKKKKGFLGGDKSKPIGIHGGPEVLNKEKETANFHKHMYPDSSIKKFVNLRKSNGEYSSNLQKVKQIQKQVDKLRIEKQHVMSSMKSEVEKLEAAKGISSKIKALIQYAKNLKALNINKNINMNNISHII